MVDADHPDDHPTLTNGELATQIVGSIVFTVGFYLPLKNILGAVQPMSSYAQYLTPLIVLQAIFFAAVSAAFRSAMDARPASTGVSAPCRWPG